MCRTLEALSETTIARNPTASRSRDGAHGALDERGRGGAAVLELQVLLERSRVHADADGAAALAGPPGDLLQALGAADVSRVDPHLVGAGVDAGDRQPVIEMDVGDERQRHARANFCKRGHRIVAGDGHPDDLAPGALERPDLTHRGADVVGVGLGHRLDAHRRAAAEGQRPDPDRARVWSAAAIAFARFSPGCSTGASATAEDDRPGLHRSIGSSHSRPQFPVTTRVMSL